MFKYEFEIKDDVKSFIQKNFNSRYSITAVVLVFGDIIKNVRFQSAFDIVILAHQPLR